MAEGFHPVDIDNLIEDVWTSMWESTIQKLDIELWPHIEKLNVLEYMQYKDSSVKHISNWLVDKKRTPEEFNYILGPLVQSLNKYNKRANYVTHNIEINNICPLFLGFLTAEALAIKKPILLGLWENVAWFFIRYIRDFHYLIEKENHISDVLNDWIICMMADPDLCPNPYLRLEFIDTFGKIVDINNTNERKAFQSLMIACSTLNHDPIKDFLSQKDNCSEILWYINMSWIRFLEMSHEYLDEVLTDKLWKVFQTVIPDAQCIYKMESNINNWSYEVNCFSIIFQTVSGYAHQMYKIFHENLNASLEDIKTILCNFYVISNIPYTIILLFPESFQTPQLVDVISSCIIDIFELALWINIDLVVNHNTQYYEGLFLTCELLEEYGLKSSNCNDCLNCNDCMIDHTLTSPIAQTLIHKYPTRFSNLRQQLDQLSSAQLARLSLDHYDVMCSFLYHCNYHT